MSLFGKALKVLIMAALLATLFAGCQSEADKEDEAFLLPKTTTPVTLKFYISEDWKNSALPWRQQHPDIRKVLDEVEKRSKTDVNASLDFKWIPQQDYFNTIKTLLESKDNFDAFIAPVSFPEWSQALAAEHIMLDDLLLDISKLFPDNAPKLYSEFTDEERREASFEGKLMAIPHHMPGSYRLSAVVRKDMMEKYEIPEIKNFEDYEVYLKTIKEKEDTLVPMTSAYTVNFLDSFGYLYQDPYLVYKWDGSNIKLIPWEQTGDFKTAVATIKGWHVAGYTYMNGLSRGTEYPLIIDNVSSYLDTWDSAQRALRTFGNIRIGKNDGLSLAVYPLNPERKALKSPITGASVLINKNAQNPDRAIRFIEWVESDQNNYDLFMYGLDGEHYTLKNDMLVFPKSQLNGNKYPFAGWWGSEAFLNIDLMRGNESDPANFKEEYKRNAELNCDYSPLTGFIPDYSTIMELVDKRAAEVNQFEQDMSSPISYSLVDVNEFIQKQKDGGVEKIREVLQKQIDDWLAKK